MPFYSQLFQHRLTYTPLLTTNPPTLSHFAKQDQKLQQLFSLISTNNREGLKSLPVISLSDLAYKDANGRMIIEFGNKDTCQWLFKTIIEPYFQKYQQRQHYSYLPRIEGKTLCDWAILCKQPVSSINPLFKLEIQAMMLANSLHPNSLENSREIITAKIADRLLTLAARGDDLALINSLLMVPLININTIIEDQTALLVASQFSNPPIVQLLINKGALVNPKTSLQPLHAAVLRNDIRLAKLLLANQAKTSGSRGLTPLYLAAMHGNAEMVELLLSYSTREVNEPCRVSPNGLYSYPLLEACMHKHPKVVEALINAGADVNVDWLEKTALSFVVEQGSIALVKRLIDAGANVSEEQVLIAEKQNNAVMSFLLTDAWLNTFISTRSAPNTPEYSYCFFCIPWGFSKQQERDAARAFIHARKNGKAVPPEHLALLNSGELGRIVRRFDIWDSSHQPPIEMSNI